MMISAWTTDALILILPGKAPLGDSVIFLKKKKKKSILIKTQRNKKISNVLFYFIIGIIYLYEIFRKGKPILTESPSVVARGQRRD